MLATEVKNLHQNKIYLVQFALNQFKTSIFFVIFGFAKLQKFATKQCCPRLLYASSSSFFSFFSFDFVFGSFFYSFFKSTSSFALNSSCLSTSFSSLSIFLFFGIYIFSNPFFCLEIPLQLLDKRSQQHQQSWNAHCFWTNFLQKSLAM